MILLSGGMWDERWTTYQRIATEFRREFRVLYVEGNYSFGKLVKGLLRKGPYPITLLGRLRKVEDGLHVLTPPPRLPFRHFLRPIGVLNQALLGCSVRRAARRLGMHAPVLWSFLHQSDRLLGRLGERLRVYHCVDHWAWLLPKVFLMGHARRIEADEARTAAKAVFTVSTSRFLTERMQGWNPRSFHVPNAADLELFREDSSVTPPDLAPIPRPILGFSGTLEAKSDLDLLRRVALERPSWSLVFLGHGENVSDLDKLLDLDNVHFLGMKARGDLARYFRHFAVCMVPFRKTPELDSISPLKVFEYLAAGRPVVATRYREIADLEGLVYLADGTEDFLENLERAMAEDCPERRKERRDFAARNSWRDRGKALLDLIDRFGADASEEGDSASSGSPMRPIEAEQAGCMDRGRQ
ncbi:MAG: glycosyltransferase [Planctomycetota bacterium]